MRTIGVALVGCGYWGTNLCRVLNQTPSCRLTWVCDPSPSALARAARIAPGVSCTQEVEAVLTDPDTKAVVVATPVDLHFQIAIQALTADKHVFVEKPLTRSVAEAQILCTEADNRRLVLMVGHTFMYNGAVRRIKSLIDGGELGDIRYVFSRRLNLGIVRHDVDALWNLAPHDLSMFNYWINQPVEKTFAVGHSYLRAGIADVVFAHLAYAGDIGGHVQVSWLDPSKVRQATVVGSKRMLVFDDMSADARIVVYDKGVEVTSTNGVTEALESYAQHQVKVRAGDAWMPRVDYPEPLQEQMRDFIGCMHEGRRPVADGLSGLEVVRLLQRLTESMQLMAISGR